MKKLFCLAVSVLYAALLASCARGTPVPVEDMLNPGDEIGNMTVEKHSTYTRYPTIWDYCIFQPEETKPSTRIIDCEIPLIPRMEIRVGWGAKEATILDSNWSVMVWEMFIDDYQINLDNFGQWNESDRPDLGVNYYARGWILDLNNLSAGKHTLRYFWISEDSINDGFDIYEPGKYELIVNFTVLDE